MLCHQKVRVCECERKGDLVVLFLPSVVLSFVLLLFPNIRLVVRRAAVVVIIPLTLSWLRKS